MQNWVHRISCACIMNSWNLNRRSYKKTGRILPHFCCDDPFAHVFTVSCCIISSCNVLSADWDFLFTLFVQNTEDAACTLPPPANPSFSLWIKMSLAVQLWLTPSVPHPAEQLPLFDESGPVCFPAPPGVWCMTALPLKMQLYSAQTKKGGRAGSVFFFFLKTLLFTEHLKTLWKRKEGEEMNAAFFFFFAEAEKWFALAIQHQRDACREVNKEGMCTVPWSSG